MIELRDVDEQQSFLARLADAIDTSPVVLVNTFVAPAAALLAGFSDPEFQHTLAQYPDGTIAYPHLMRPRAVPGICVA